MVRKQTFSSDRVFRFPVLVRHGSASFTLFLRLSRFSRALLFARARARGKVFYITLGLARERGHGSLLISALTS